MFSFETKIGREAVMHSPIVLSSADYMTHLYVVGQTGTGKSTLLENAFNDVVRWRCGGMFIDPHGDSFEGVLNSIPKERTNDVVLIDLMDEAHPPAFNPLADVPKHRLSRVTSDVVSTLAHVMDLSPDKTPRIYGFLENSIYVLAATGNSSLGDIPELIENELSRYLMLRHVKHLGVLQFWNDFDGLSPTKKRERSESTLSRIRSLFMNPIVESVLGQRKSRIDFRSILDEQKLVVVNLAKGYTGDNAARLFGGMLVHSVFLAALGRIDTKPHLRRPFYLFADEFPVYGVGSGTLKETLSEVRKYGLGVVLGNQYTEQVSPEVINAIIGNVGSIVSFRVGSSDAQRLHKQLDCNETLLMDLPNHSARVRVLKEGDTTRAYTVKTYPPKRAVHANEANIRKRSRERYAAPYRIPPT